MISFILALFLCVLHHHCFASNIGSEPYLVFSTWFTVSRMDLDGSDYSVLVDSTTNSGLQAVDYHLRLNKLFWTHYRDGSVQQANIDGSNASEIVFNVTRPSALAVDWINDKIYYSFGDFGSLEVNPNHLAVYDISTGANTEITANVNQQYAVFHDIGVDPKNRKLYWTTGSALVRSSLSGENAEVLSSPSCHTRYLGLRSNALYWIEDCGSVESVHSLDLSTLQEDSPIVTTHYNSYYSDVASYGEAVYWTGLGRVYAAPAAPGSSPTELLHISSIATNFRGIVVVHPDLQPCPALEPYLLFSTWFTVSRMNLDSSDNVGPQAVDYHFCINKLFWTHYRDGTVHQANIDGSNPTVMVSNVTRPSALAVDWVNNKVYFSFGDHGSNLVHPNHLAIYDITTSQITEITSAITSNAVFRDLAVDPESQKLYWTTGSALVRSSLSGENAEVLSSPSCHTRYLGLRSNALYWVEDCGSVESVHSLDLSTLQEDSPIVTTHENSFYSDVTSYGEAVYWTGLGRVYSAPAAPGSSPTELLHISSIATSFRGIVVVHPDLQPCHITQSPSSTSLSPGVSPTSTAVISSVQSPTPSPMSTYNTHPPTSALNTPHSPVDVQLPHSSSPIPSNKESSATSFEVTVPLTAGVSVAATIAVVVLLLCITLGVIFFLKKSKTKTKQQSTAQGRSGDEYITISSNTVYNVFEKPPAPVSDDDYEKMDPVESIPGNNQVFVNNTAAVVSDTAAVSSDNHQLYEEIDESVTLQQQ